MKGAETPLAILFFFFRENLTDLACCFSVMFFAKKMGSLTPLTNDCTTSVGSAPCRNAAPAVVTCLPAKDRPR